MMKVLNGKFSNEWVFSKLKYSTDELRESAMQWLQANYFLSFRSYSFANSIAEKHAL